MTRERFKLSFESPASPTRVVQLARDLERLVVAAGLDPASDDITIIIENYKLRAAATGNSSRGAAALQLFAEVISDPELKRSEVTDGHRAVAGAVAEMLTHFRDDGPMVTLPGKVRARRVSADLATKLDASSRRDTPAVRISYSHATVISPVLRCGSTEENGAESARLIINGKPYELPIEKPESSASFHDAAKTKGAHRVEVVLAFRHCPGGREFSPAHSRAVRVVHRMAPGGGMRFLTAAKSLRFYVDEGAK